MQSVVLTSSNLSDNESSLCHYRSIQRVRTAQALAKSGHVVYAGLWAPDGNIRPSEESAQAFAKEHSVDLRMLNSTFCPNHLSQLPFILR
jgi:hypothetical protein